MNDILVQHENLLHASSLNSFDRVAEIKMQLVKHMLVEDGSDNTYRSTFASSSLSSVLSQVGCHIGISKYLTRKGQTTLSEAKNKKYLLAM
jgi:hypothetical protein